MLTLSDPMDCSTPGFPVHHQLLELAQTHVHQVGDAIQPYYNIHKNKNRKKIKIEMYFSPSLEDIYYHHE